MSGTPTSIAQQALDAAGVDQEIGDIEDGTRPSRVLLRAYRQCLMQLLRAAHWDFARSQEPLVLLADATGNTPNVGTIVSNTQFYYAYAYPINAMKLRFIPMNVNQNPGAPGGNITPVNPSPPLGGNLGQAPATGRRLIPARFNIGTDPNFAAAPGQISWEVQGISPEGRTVVYTNVKDAHAIYTALIRYPSMWDAQFRAAFVAYLASEIVLPLHRDKRLAIQIRNGQIAIAKDKIQSARCTDGNEMWSNVDHVPDWVRTRSTGGGSGWPGWFGAGAGLGGWGDGCFGGWDSINFSDGGGAY